MVEQSNEAPVKPESSYNVPPLQWDEERDEPFVELEIRGQKYRMTMWRETDGDDMVRNWDHPLVGKWSFKRPYPFTHSHLPETWDLFLTPDRAAIPTYRELYNSPSSFAHKPKPKRYVLRALRLPSGQMVGNTDLFSYIDEEGNEKWEIAYDLDPDYWGKGLGGGMIGFLVQWAGWVGVGVVTAKVASANSASQGVLKSNGFSLQWCRMGKMPEDKGGAEVEFGEWARRLNGP